MSERGSPPPEQARETAEQQALRLFATDFLVPKVLALEDSDDSSYDFVFQLHTVLPEASPYLVSALSESEDPEHRMLATGYLRLTFQAAPDTVAAIAHRLLSDPNPEALEYATEQITLDSDPEFSNQPIAAALRQVLDDRNESR